MLKIIHKIFKNNNNSPTLIALVIHPTKQEKQTFYVKSDDKPLFYLPTAIYSKKNTKAA